MICVWNESKEEFLGKKGDIDTFMALFEKHNEDFRKQVGVSVSATTLRKYELCKRHFAEFLKQEIWSDRYKVV